MTAVAIWRSLGFTDHHLFLAGLQQIPRYYYEAARIDGANRWQIFWRITLPLLNPVIVYLAVLADNHIPAYVRPRAEHERPGQGGPLNSTTTVVLEVYNEGFRPATTWATLRPLTVISLSSILAITVFQLRVLSRRVEY